jgi:ABC-type nitrate/sulfonate/bicarbonate transport system substrate-binding protein
MFGSVILLSSQSQQFPPYWAVLALATLLSLVSTRSYIKKDPETVRRFLMAYNDGVERLYIDKELAMKVMGKYTKTADRGALICVLRKPPRTNRDSPSRLSQVQPASWQKLRVAGISS